MPPWREREYFLMNMRDERRKMDAMLRHLGCGHHLRDFPGTMSEKLALIRTAGARGLVAWTKSRAQYELTSAGWNALMPTRRFGVAALIVTAATGAMAGAVAAAVFWLPADASYSPGRRQSASISHPATQHVPRISRAAEISPPGPVALTPTSLLQDVVAVTAEPDTNASEGLDRPNLAARPVADQPRAEVVLNGTTEAEAKQSKKSRHKAAHHRRREQGRSWARADPWRARSTRYADYGGQRGWYGY